MPTSLLALAVAITIAIAVIRVPTIASPEPWPLPLLSAVVIQALFFAGGAERIPHQTCTGHCYRHRRSSLWHPSPRRRHPFAMPIGVGDEFVDFKAFKAAIADWSMNGKHKFSFPYQKSDNEKHCGMHPCRLFLPCVFSHEQGRRHGESYYQPHWYGGCDAAPQCSKPASLAAAHSPCNLYSHEESHIIRCQLHTLQQNALRGASWVTTWKARQCNFVCRLHMWIPSVLQTCEHMYC